jgi:RNA polymerase nonessential primary-like sigma factor
MAALATLSEREREIVLLRYGFDGTEGWTYSVIAERFGISAERVRQIERAALSKLASPHGRFTSLDTFLPSVST